MNKQLSCWERCKDKGEAQDVRDAHQSSVNLNGAANQSGPGPEQAHPASMERFATAQEYSLNFQQEQASPAVHHVNKPPTAPPGPATGYNADAAVTVQITNMPGARLYPPIPDQQGHIPRAVPREEVGGLFSSPMRPGSPPEAQDSGFAEDAAFAAGRGPSSRHQSPNGKAFFAKRHQQHGSLSGVVQGKVVHMRRTEAWTKFIAYEGCLQVCIAELDGGNNADARYFVAGGFTTLRKGLGIDGLLLSQMATSPAAGSGIEGCINDICWDDLEPPEKRLNTITYAKATATCYMRVRCQRLSLPAATVLQKLCCRTRTQMSLQSFAGIHVHLAPSDDSCDTVGYALDSHGTAVDRNEALVLPMDSSQNGAQPVVQPPQRVDILVEGPSGAVASGSVSYRELLRMAALQRDPVDEMHASSNSAGATVEVQVRGAGEYKGKVAFVTLIVMRVRKDVARYDLAQVASDGSGVDTVNKNTLRTNACLAYDATMGAALEATGCGRHKLLVEGPWEWLLSCFASYFGVRSFYCILAHLRWVLKPGVATISTMCLDVITAELRPLLEQSTLRGLTTHELTLLEGVKKAVEMLLEVALENYYSLGDDQPRDIPTPEAAHAAAPTWKPTVLMASFRLFRVMKDVFLPTDQDWLNTRFRFAAKKRWHFLECNCGYDQIRDLPRAQPPHMRSPGDLKLGEKANTYDSYYKMAEKMGVAIRNDLDFDMFLQNLPDLLPSSLNLPRITAEEYMANFVEILRNMLGKCPPLAPSIAAVDLLVATASLQRYLQCTQMYLPRQHPGHLDAMELWRLHVLSWIDSSRKALCTYCSKLEAEAKLTAAHLARVDVAKMPGMIEGIEGAVAPLVRDMLDRTWAELTLYERVIKNWPLFGPQLEAALCDVLRTVQGSLNRICAGASNVTMLQQPGGSPHVNGAHRRAPSGPHPTSSPGGHAYGTRHGRAMSGIPYGNGSPGMGGRQHHGSPGAAMGPQQQHHHGIPSAGGMPGARNAVLLKEAVLLNSLKVLMVMVPSIEDIISKWCGGSAVAPPGPPQTDNHGVEYNDELGPHIGAQFAQVVKELRTDYAEGVASCATRMANHIRSMPATNIKVALNLPKPPSDVHAGYQQVSTMTQQREFVEAFMRPILAACEDALQALRSALDPRVFVATGRALWDCMGKDLFEFVHCLQEGHDNKGAWRLRQHANIALTLLCESFRGRLADWMEHCIGERDLDLPIHVDKAQKLLAQNTAVVNITLNPI
ncbi:hypothetical protein VOLCADRAFT_102849 [Volvox carteri f. nagariensis]|uniref:MHD1 domain-containing protein n=1 Tax=Volvox carteri f. nagariensis TaxID=3068 RepID=D8TIH4_VOLCA|nr:uncharacterized protein VOLCADRAFT_102849 [Volvox carteri f. nagariensis]EFJ52891.1 hypothetical protein VOLCADRAFT_102849 [Volvox carteri f. nagariensis]|eukprot:XP_002945896.1 hypothetical protein VOLCADRAFT_102849 [Volvox carteri f. nagariensis]